MPSETDRIEKKVLLRATRARVWRALTDSNELGSWFGMKIDGPFAKGATVHATIAATTADPEIARAQQPYVGLPLELLIEDLEPERLFSFRWHPHGIEKGVDYEAEPTTLVVFELEEAPGGILLTVTESGFDQIPIARRAKAFAGNSGGWAMQMILIGQYLEQTP